MAGKVLSKALGRTLPAIGKFVKATVTPQVAENIAPVLGSISEYADAPGIRGRAAQFIGGLNPETVGQAAGEVAGMGTEVGASAAVDALMGMRKPSPQQPSSQQIDPRQQAHYNAMFAQHMQMSGGMQPAYAPSPMEQATPPGRLIAQQGNNRTVSQYYYNPSDPLTAAAKIYASMPKTSFPVGSF